MDSKTLDGPAAQPDSKQILLNLFQRTVKMSLIITISCILLGYPVALLLANLPIRASNILMILVLLPDLFAGSDICMESDATATGVINEVLVWLGLVAADNRLEIINNQFGTIVAMTHILLPFMILPCILSCRRFRQAMYGLQNHWARLTGQRSGELIFRNLCQVSGRDQFWFLFWPLAITYPRNCWWYRWRIYFQSNSLSYFTLAQLGAGSGIRWHSSGSCSSVVLGL